MTADPRRGTLDVNWTKSSSSSSSPGTLKLEWKDRRTRSVVDSHTIFPEDDCTYSRVETGNDKDRVYLLQYGNASGRRFFFWMQDKEEGNSDEENCVKINIFMADPAEASAAAKGEESPSSKANTGTTPASSSSNSDGENVSTSRIEGGGLDSAALMQIMQGINTSNNDSAIGGAASSGTSGAQVDTLSNILENLGIPQNASNISSSSANVTTPAPNTNDSTPSLSNVPALTLSDLQGAMAGLATTSPPSQQLLSSGPPLHEVASIDAIIESGILNDDEIKNKLIALLPEGQRTEDKLMENLRSPQVAQCFKSLTAALNDDVSSFNSILANFQLKPEDGAAAMIAGNPIQAFLDCVLKSVEREKGEKNGSSGKEEGKDADGDSEMKE